MSAITGMPNRAYQEVLYSTGMLIPIVNTDACSLKLSPFCLFQPPTVELGSNFSRNWPGPYYLSVVPTEYAAKGIKRHLILNLIGWWPDWWAYQSTLFISKHIVTAKVTSSDDIGDPVYLSVTVQNLRYLWLNVQRTKQTIAKVDVPLFLMQTTQTFFPL